MKFAYMAIPTKQPVPSLAGALVRYRPVIAVMLMGTATPQLRDGLLDTGADDTVFSDAVATALGLDLGQAEQRAISLAGRPQPVFCRYAQVHLRISDGTESGRPRSGLSPRGFITLCSARQDSCSTSVPISMGRRIPSR